MAEESTDRVKFCRYCDGLIQWDAEACPHCGMDLKLETFDEMEFVGDSGPPPKMKGLRAPPTVQPVGQEPPVVVPLGEVPPTVTPIEEPPTVTPIEEPPIVEPVRPRRRAAGPPRVEPIADDVPVVEPIGGPAVRPARAPRRKLPPEVTPVVTPIEDDVPVVQPIGGGELPPTVSPLAECPVCEAEMDDPSAVGGTCNGCGATMCVACMMRANGIRVSTSSDRNLERWDAHRSRARPSQIRCAACGQRGVDLA